MKKSGNEVAIRDQAALAARAWAKLESAATETLNAQNGSAPVVDREIVQGFEKLAVVPPLVPTPRAAGIERDGMPQRAIVSSLLSG
ncbi:MAG: hypothetical protein WCC90_03785 [Methylocella sp.]